MAEACREYMGEREVFLVQHVHTLDDDEEEDVKTIGIYSTREAARQAVERLRLRPGFRDAPAAFQLTLTGSIRTVGKMAL
jgi:hypothetical protein